MEFYLQHLQNLEKRILEELAWTPVSMKWTKSQMLIHT